MHWHVVDNWCGFRGGEDYGFVSTPVEAGKAIEDQIAAGNKGGCRHDKSGWLVKRCDKDSCHEYNSVGWKMVDID
jgi:hypothetical protein